MGNRMEWIANPEIWIALLTLTVLEVVLGIDNVIFISILAGKLPMTRVGRAREAGETQGFMKVLVDADSQRLLGAAILGLNGDEIVHSLLDVMYTGKPYTTIQRAMHIHPTVTELVPTLLGNLQPFA